MAEKHSDVLTIDDEEEEAVLEEKEKDLLEQSPSVEDTEKVSNILLLLRIWHTGVS